MERTFNIPKIRNAYLEWTGFEWPHDDDYLHELAQETRAKIPPNEPGNQEHLLYLMRECHEFTIN